MAPASPSLSDDETARYLRHILLDEVGVAGQLALKRARVLCIGAGGLGSPALLYLAAAGVGTIGIVDADTVDASNLQRQILYTTADADARAPKVEVAAARLRAHNPHLAIETFATRFDEHNADALLAGFDAILDGTDNFETRYLVNDVAIKQRKPSFFGSIFKFTGQVSVFTADTGCYRCVFPAPPSPELAPDCARAGVLGALPGIVGTYQALECLKWILGIGELLTGRLLLIDTLASRFRTLSYQRDPACACASADTIQLGGYAALCASTTAEAAPIAEISVHELAERLRGPRDFVLLDVREPAEYALGNLGGLPIPVDSLEQQAAQLPPDRDTPVFVHCRSGQRSARACGVLQRLGYRHVYNVAGGVLAWQREIDRSFRV